VVVALVTGTSKIRSVAVTDRLIVFVDFAVHLDPFLYLFDDYIWYLRTVNTSLGCALASPHGITTAPISAPVHDISPPSTVSSSSS
jgi:hypothetical protein